MSFPKQQDRISPTTLPSIELERQRALRAVLQKPLLTPSGEDAEEYRLVRTHAAWLREWFMRNAEWTLHVDSELVRLRKIPADLGDPTRPAVNSKRVSFTRRKYVLLCLALSALEAAERQIILGKLAESMMEYVAADPTFAAAGLGFDLKSIDERRDLVDIVKVLGEKGVLRRVDGDEQQFLNRTGDALYNINRPVLAAMLVVRNSPSAVRSASFSDRLEAITEEFVAETDEGRNRRIRSSLVRRLLDDPVLYFQELNEEQRAYLSSQRGFLIREISTATGLIPEVRREGIAMVDPHAEMTDLGMPEEGTDGHVALLLAEELARHGKRNPGVSVGFAFLHQHLAQLIEEHGAHWRRDVREPGSEQDLLAQTVQRLVALRLARITPDGVEPLPAIARFALGQVSTMEKPS
jgi:uncharacterized protein (TIGR02678 family)